MTTLGQIYELLRWELLLEWRNKYALGSVFLYVVSTVVIAYLAFIRGMGAISFNAVYWIILFFGATVAAGRSFVSVAGRRHAFYYTLADPLAILFSKQIFNTLIIWLIGALTYALLALFAPGVELVAPLPFVAAVALGGIGLGVILTFVSALAARASGNSTLMAILSFPLVVPLLKVLVDTGTYGFGEGINDPTNFLTLIAVIDLLALAVGVVLFPFVWRD
jgi:heme exporter protein B